MASAISLLARSPVGTSSKVGHRRLAQLEFLLRVVQVCGFSCSAASSPGGDTCEVSLSWLA